MNILLVEDNEAIVKGLKYSLEKEQYGFKCCNCVNDATVCINENDDIDLIILDVTLPDGNGFELYEKTIMEKNIPTIFLTAKDDEESIVKGLDLGADDYITKPFYTKELLARIKKASIKKRKQNIISVGDISFNTDSMTVMNKGETLELTSLELKLLSLLFMNLGTVVTRSRMLDKIWEWTGNDVDDHTVTVYMKRIREKLGSDIITTVKGMGYRIDEK